MVKPIPVTKQETRDEDDDLPDYEDDEDEPKDAWRLPNFKEREENLRDTIKKKGVHPVDPISIALKKDPIPVKD